MKSKKKFTGFSVVILAMALMLMTGLSGCGTDFDEEAGKLSWLMTPDQGYNRDDLKYNDSAELYYISSADGPDTYITPSGEAIKDIGMTGDYAYLADLPLPQKNTDGKTVSYSYADGTSAFDGKYANGTQVQGTGGKYLVVYDENWKPTVIDKKGKTVYKSAAKAEGFSMVTDTICQEMGYDGVSLVDVETGKVIHREENAVLAQKAGIGYIFHDAVKDRDYLLDEDFLPLWDGETFESIWDGGRTGCDGLLVIKEKDQYTFKDKDGKDVLKLEPGEYALPSDGKILTYTSSRITCYDMNGKEMFSKDTEKKFLAVNHELEGFVGGFAAVTPDGEHYGIINEKGEMLTDCIFDYASVKRNGTAYVILNQEAGILDLRE